MNTGPSNEAHRPRRDLSEDELDAQWLDYGPDGVRHGVAETALTDVAATDIEDRFDRYVEQGVMSPQEANMLRTGHYEGPGRQAFHHAQRALALENAEELPKYERKQKIVEINRRFPA